MSWPIIEESVCPWCDRPLTNLTPRRQHDDGCEYECPHCKRTHVRKEGDPDCYAFFGGDIEAMCDTDRKPMDLGD